MSITLTRFGVVLVLVAAGAQSVGLVLAVAAAADVVSEVWMERLLPNACLSGSRCTTATATARSAIMKWL